MSGDPFSGPDWDEYVRLIRSELIPKLTHSAYVMSLVPKGGLDVKFAVELGFSIMLDKPIIAVVAPGTKVPAKLIAVADEIVESDIGNPERMTERMLAAIERIKVKLEEGEK